MPAGTTTAIVGETGAGKTTLGYLVSRLYDTTRGTVTIDGVDVRELTFASLRGVRRRRLAGDVPLPRDASRENLRFAKPDATDEEVEEAARAAQIHDLISSLPDGYETVVGERGYRFSGGEKQRIAIARAILRNPPILVLDEATSALDTQTERAVQEALDRLVEGRTTIAIAHRLSTIRDADQIVVLDGGRVVETGLTTSSLAAAATRSRPATPNAAVTRRPRAIAALSTARCRTSSCRTPWSCRYGSALRPADVNALQCAVMPSAGSSQLTVVSFSLGACFLKTSTMLAFRRLLTGQVRRASVAPEAAPIATAERRRARAATASRPW